MAAGATKKIPYGISDYEVIRKENYYYIDKTAYLSEIEDAGKYLFLLRPRRFGKSLLLSLMETYYDIGKKEQFDFYFKGTAIHKNPTRERNSYLILKFNFSSVEPELNKVEKSFLNNVKITCGSFLVKYRELILSSARGAKDFEKLKSDIDQKDVASDILLNTINLCRELELKLYILIDEYDNFANTILATLGSSAYKKLTHGSGFLRSFFNVLKAGTTGSGSPVSRLFVTGVSPITMDDVTSGFNIGKNISLDGKFNEMLGLTREEVTQAVEFYRTSGLIKHETGALLGIMKIWYYNYRFSRKSDVHLFNTDMVIYFFDEYFKDHEIPAELVDDNVRIDYEKLKHLIIVDRGDRKRPNGNFGRLKIIIENGYTLSNLVRNFSVERITSTENFISLLFYFGLLTIDGEERGKIRFKIPNEAVKKLYYEYIKFGYEETDIFSLDFYKYSELMSDMAYEGKWEPFFIYLTDQMKESMSLRDLIQGEKSIQAFLTIYLGLGNLYLVYPEKELNKGYADIVLEPFFIKYPDMKYAYVLEIKYIKPKEYSKNALEKSKAEAETQLNNYTLDKKFQKSMGNTSLIKLVLIFSGHRLKYLGHCL